MKIDFISDVTCPWCAIGLQSLEQAVARLGDAVEVDIEPQPFELNPDLPPEGEEIARYVARKYGAGAEQLAARQELIRQRAAKVGLRFGVRTRVWNTLDAHRLLHWAKIEGRALELKHALLAAYHTRGENPAARDVLLKAAEEAGLDADRARAVIDSDEYAREVREVVRHWQSLGINSVPTIIIDGRYLIEGGQPVEVFESALREVAATTAAA
jgi:predicted DsbA family dithiol-disulfide isomerase